jgi:hypothetical protein
MQEEEGRKGKQSLYQTHKKTHSLPIHKRYKLKYANHTRLYSLPNLAGDHVTIFRQRFKCKKKESSLFSPKKFWNHNEKNMVKKPSKIKPHFLFKKFPIIIDKIEGE